MTTSLDTLRLLDKWSNLEAADALDDEADDPLSPLSVEVEYVCIGGEDVKLRRVYVQTADSANYHKLGWVLSSDCEKCMICASEFYFWSGKYHCHCCGNILCADCCPETAIVVEIRGAGRVAVCKLCFWGQDEVHADILDKRHHQFIPGTKTSLGAPVEYDCDDV
jgi:hypothetical protein